MSRLGLTLPHRQYETPYSYVSRLVALNGVKFAEDFVSDIGLSWQAIWEGDEAAVRDMACLASQDPEALLRCNIHRLSATELIVGGEIFPSTNLQRTSLKVCPRCLREDQQKYGQFGPYFRVYWATSHSRVCTHHGMLLLTVPKGVHRRSAMDTWGQLSDQWALIEDEALVPYDRLSAGFPQYQIKRLAGKHSNVWLDQFPLAIASQLCEYLGMALLHSDRRSTASCTSEELVIAIERGFDAAQHGPTRIWNALREVRRSSTAMGSTFLSDFGILHNWLKKTKQDDIDHRPILDAFAQFGFQEYSFAPGERFLGLVCPERRNYCPVSLAQDYGLDIVMARKILRGLQGDSKPYKTPIVKADWAGPFVERFCRSLLPHETEAALGVDRAVLARLVENKLLAAPIKIAGCNDRYDPDDLSRFQQKIFARSKPVNTQSDGFALMRELRTMFSIRLDTMCQWICSGFVTKVEHCKDATAFQDIALSIDEVRSKLAQSRQPDFSKAELKSILCVNDTTTAHLVREKLISGEKLKNSFNNKIEHRFWPKDIDDFLEEYVSLGLFAKTLFLQPFAARQRLARNGVLPLELPPKCSRIFLRKDLTECVLTVPLDWRSLVNS